MDGDSAIPTEGLAAGCGRWPVLSNSEPVRDCGDLLWASMDDAYDLNLLGVAEALPERGGPKIRVAVAHVDAFIKHGSAIDEYALAFDLFAW